MRKIDLIIEALERANELWLTEPMGEQAIAAAYELKAELAKLEQAEYEKLTVKFGERAKEYLEDAKKSWQPDPEREAYDYATSLARYLWEKHYKVEAPGWTPLPDVLGVLTQIDNMICGLEKTNPEMPTKIVGPNLEQILNAAGFYRREWVGLTNDERNKMIGRIQHDQYTRQRDLIGSTQIITEMYLKEKNT